jgi:hypothetical protein
MPQRSPFALAARVAPRALMGAVFALAAWAHAQDTPREAVPAAPPAATSRYTFSWPLDTNHPRPRGGSTRGVPVQLATEPSPGWAGLQAPGLKAQERDRRAILAMAGDYRVSFDFLEVAAYPAGAVPRAPYQSWGTERIYVDRNDPGFVSLVHILEMRFVGTDGAPSEPLVTKHWRQDWTYQPRAIVEYRGRDRWQQRSLATAEVRGAWMQTVYQVDESPRYAALGRWVHNGSFSTWIGGDTWRPLPRREWSVRDDYQALRGTNRHTVGPTGWLQEENNLKVVLDERRVPDSARPYVGREYGVARYERLRQTDFAAADRYYERTRDFWNQVRDAWALAFTQQHGTVTLAGPVDKLGLFTPLFERADEIAERGASAVGADDTRLIRAALRKMGALK